MILDTLFSNPLLKQNFPTQDILAIKDISTNFVTSYEVTLTNTKGQNATVTLVQPDVTQPLTIVNLVTQGSLTTVQQQTTAVTTTTVNAVTGNTVFTTNDLTVLSSNVAILQLSHTVVAKLPNLIGYTVRQVTTTTYNQISESELVFVSAAEQPVQVTTLLNTSTNQVQIIDYHSTAQTTVSVSVQTIPASAISVAVKKWPEVKTILANIQTSFPSATVETIIVKDFADVKIYTPVFSVPTVTDSKTQLVFVYNETTSVLTSVDQVTVPKVVVPTVTEIKVDSFGQTVTKTNDIIAISVSNPSVPLVFQEIQATYGINITASTQSIEITQQPYATQYKLVTEVNGKLAEVIVISQNNQIKVLGLDLLPATPAQPTTQPTTSGEGAAQPTTPGETPA